MPLHLAVVFQLLAPVNGGARGADACGGQLASVVQLLSSPWPVESGTPQARKRDRRLRGGEERGKTASGSGGEYVLMMWVLVHYDVCFLLATLGLRCATIDQAHVRRLDK